MKSGRYQFVAAFSFEKGCTVLPLLPPLSFAPFARHRRSFRRFAHFDHELEMLSARFGMEDRIVVEELLGPAR